MAPESGDAVRARQDVSRAWQAGDLSIDRGLQRVEQAGQVIELPRLSFDLLLALLESAPHFVSNDELMTRVWKGLVVSPETVTQRVKLLRDALGDDPRAPRYIEGLRGRGYRMIPEVRRRVETAVMPGAPATEAWPGMRGPLEVRWALVVVLLLMAVTGTTLWLQRQSQSTVAAETPPDALLNSRSVAVLPFESTEDARLGPGLADSIAVQLSGVHDLRLIARYSTLALDTSRLDPKVTAGKLGARYLVQGQVTAEGTRRRVSVTLLDGVTGEQLWAQQYTRQETDFFGLQDEVAIGVKHALESRIAGLDPGLPSMERSQNREAWFAYLRGRTLLGRLTVTGSDAAAREFEKAAELDPDFLPAVVGLYDARMQATQLRRGDLGAQKQANAALLARARELDPDSGALRLVEAIWSDAPREQRVPEFEAGLARDPGNARAMTAFSEVLDSLDRREDAARWLERALVVDPLWPRAHFRKAQRTFAVVGSAIEQQNLRTLELDPNYYPALQRHAKYQWQTRGKMAYPISVIEQAIAGDPENPWGPHTAVAFYLDIGEPGSAERVVRASEVARGSTLALRAQYAGDWKTAGEAAFARPARVFGVPERWGVPAAIRDYALHTGEFTQALEYLSTNYNLPVGEPWKLTTDNFREAGISAHLLLRMGRKEDGIRRLDEVIEWIDANPVFGPVYNLRAKAQALALKGENDAALAELAKSFEANDYTQWWYTQRFDPTWDGLRSDPRFVKIFDSVREHVASEHAELERLRAQRSVSSGPG